MYTVQSTEIYQAREKLYTCTQYHKQHRVVYIFTLIKRVLQVLLCWDCMRIRLLLTHNTTEYDPPGVLTSYLLICQLHLFAVE